MNRLIPADLRNIPLPPQYLGEWFRIDKLNILVVNLAKVVDVDLREISIELPEAFFKSHCKKIRNNWGLCLIIPM